MVDAHRVIEPGVGGTGINQMGEAQLTDVPQPLEGRRIDDSECRRDPAGWYSREDPGSRGTGSFRTWPESSPGGWAEQWTKGAGEPTLYPKEKRKSSWPTHDPQPNLRAYVRHHAEDRPGIYRMLGPENEILYVGKSVRVKTRLLSYFRAEPAEKAGKLIRDTLAIEWDYVPNEFAALVTEMRLIKRWQPRYNVEHKRKRSFAFIKITQEAAPRILPVSRILPDGATYFGPFPRPKSLALTLGELSHVLGLRDCSGTIPVVFGDQLEFFEKGTAPRCIRAQTGSCLGPCFGGCLSSATTAGRWKWAGDFWKGRSERTPEPPPG